MPSEIACSPTSPGAQLRQKPCAVRPEGSKSQSQIDMFVLVAHRYRGNRSSRDESRRLADIGLIVTRTGGKSPLVRRGRRAPRRAVLPTRAKPPLLLDRATT